MPVLAAYGKRSEVYPGYANAPPTGPIWTRVPPDLLGRGKSRSDQTTILAAFANTSTYGGGMKIAPGADWMTAK
jgi:hypothetical protein